jgi:hypothetical protein
MNSIDIEQTQFDRAAAYGKGRVLCLQPEAVPRRQSDFWNLMEERGNNFIRARDFLDAARRADLANGVDPGPKFVERLENAFSIRLRWCPADTDPAVYVHAYRLPAKQDRPERIVVHAVNYHMPILPKDAQQKDLGGDISPPTKSGDPVVAHNLRIAVPLPLNAAVDRVEAVSPAEAVGQVRCSTENARAVLEIDALRIYQALVINLRL